jgi:hypothetical protein
VKLVFRPEDVRLSTTGVLPDSHCRVSNGIIEEISFVGAYERLKVRLDPADSTLETDFETPFYLTTEAPDKHSPKPIVATRSRPEINAVKLVVGDRVVVGLASFTVLPDKTNVSGDSVRSLRDVL